MKEFDLIGLTHSAHSRASDVNSLNTNSFVGCDLFMKNLIWIQLRRFRLWIPTGCARRGSRHVPLYTQLNQTWHGVFLPSCRTPYRHPSLQHLPPTLLAPMARQTRALRRGTLHPAPHVSLYTSIDKHQFATIPLLVHDLVHKPATQSPMMRG